MLGVTPLTGVADGSQLPLVCPSYTPAKICVLLSPPNAAP